MPERKKKKSPRSKKPAPPKETKKEARESSVSVYDLNGKVAETMTLDSLFTGDRVNSGLVYQAVLKYQAGQREGTASTKERGQVRGGGKKPWKQKGTGQARHGSRRSPIWRGGGTTFGPMPRDYSYSIPSEIRRQAVTEGLKDKVQKGKLFVVKGLELEAPKTQLMNDILGKFKLRKPLVLVIQKDPNLLLASRNLPGVSVKTAQEVNVLDLASHQECLMTKAAYQSLVKRLKG